MRARAGNIRLMIARWIVELKYVQDEARIYEDNSFSEIVKVWQKISNTDSGKLKTSYTIEIEDNDDYIEVMRKEGIDYFRLATWEENKKKVKLGRQFNVSGFNLILRHVLFRLVRNEGFILHGSSAVDDTGKLHIFMAKSGGGKSTTARQVLISRRFRPVSDDLLVILRENGNFVCYSTGLLEKNSLPVNFRFDKFVLYEINKNDKFSLSPVSRNSDKLRIILNQVWFETELTNSSTTKLIFRFAEESQLNRLSLPLGYAKLAEKIYETL